MKGIISVLIFSLICGIECQRTVATTCTADRTKSSYCNTENNCEATGLILCLGTSIGQTFNCSSAEQYCAVSERGDYCTSSNPCATGGGSESANFQCTSTGYFPNPKNCSSYFFCSLLEDKSDYFATQYNCPSGNVFSPSTGNYCTRQTTTNCMQCSNCCGNTNTTYYYQMRYGLNSQYYALCIPSIDDPLVFVCPANSLPNLSGFPATCDYRCWRVGFFENTLDSSKYFECYLNPGLITVQIVQIVQAHV